MQQLKHSPVYGSKMGKHNEYQADFPGFWNCFGRGGPSES